VKQKNIFGQEVEPMNVALDNLKKAILAAPPVSNFVAFLDSLTPRQMLIWLVSLYALLLVLVIIGVITK
jgi:hypothetical protein